MSTDYGNLGNVLKTRGDLDGAKKMYNKALKIATPAGFNKIESQLKKLLRELNKKSNWLFE